MIEPLRQDFPKTAAQGAPPAGSSPRHRILAMVLLALLPSVSWSENQSRERAYAEETWGIGIGLRYADIPYVAEDQSVTDILPLLFYESEKVFIRGIEGGIKIFTHDDWQGNALLRYRFFDIPKEFQNDIQGGWDVGVQLKRSLGGKWALRAELMTDGRHRSYVDVGIETFLGDDFAGLWPYVGVRFKSADFNDHYYGLDRESFGGGMDIRVGVEGRYHLAKNLYAIGKLGGYYLDRDARRSSLVKDEFSWQAFAGIGFFNDPGTERKARLGNRPYWRIAHGWATPSNIGEILRWDTAEDPYNNTLTSLFYGHPLTDTLFGLPLDIYLTPGLVFHHNSEVQDRFYEYVVAIKAYYTLKWPVRLRFGAAEGLSYSSQITYIERKEMEDKGYRPSKLLNYLDFSVDVNVGDLFNSRSAKRLWFGYSIHHRSGIFESNSQFGRIKGGSNYNTLYLQWHF